MYTFHLLVLHSHYVYEEKKYAQNMLNVNNSYLSKEGYEFFNNFSSRNIGLYIKTKNKNKERLERTLTLALPYVHHPVRGGSGLSPELYRALC